MKLTEIDDQTLLNKISELVRSEREVTLAVLHHLREVERRHLFAELGYSSLYEYAITELKYSNGAAHRRIASMRLLKAIPEIAEKIESGALSLCALSQAQSFFRIEKTENRDEKVEILARLENKSKREVEVELMSHSTQAELHYREKVKAVTDTHTELRILVECNFTDQLEELKGLLAHSHPHASIKDLLQYALSSTLERTRPKGPKNVPNEKPLPPVETGESRLSNGDGTLKVRTRHIAAEIRREVWNRDRGRCTYSHAGRVCSSKHGLEFDHIIPFSLGGETTLENLRLRCRAHNQLEAVRIIGREQMAAFIPRFRDGI